MCKRSLVIALAAAVGSAVSFYCATGAVSPRAMGATRQVDAELVRAQFLQRLRRVADVGNLFEQKTVAPILNLKLEASTIERDLLLACPAHFRTTTVTVTEASWFYPLPSGNGHLQIPAVTINPATATGAPELTYEIIHYVYCSEWPRLHDGMQATLTFNGLPAFTCVTPSNIRSAIPEAEFVMATDGVNLVQYGGRLNDYTGTTLTFNFRAGVECALAADITQDQEKGLRYRRAQYEYQTCREVTDREFCSVHPDVAWSDRKMLGEMEGAAIRRCGTINSIYLNEPPTGVAPPVLSQRTRLSPCDERGK